MTGDSVVDCQLKAEDKQLFVDECTQLAAAASALTFLLELDSNEWPDMLWGCRLVKGQCPQAVVTAMSLVYYTLYNHEEWSVPVVFLGIVEAEKKVEFAEQK